MCAGRVHPKLVQYAFAKGAGLVLVTGCHPPGDCHYLSGNLRAKARIEKLKTKLAAQGLDPDRLQLAWISATEGRAFQQLIQEMTEKLADLNAGIFAGPAAAPDSSGSETENPEPETGP
jgi:coenzyme F420-reducing hydrogenase delta subunit